MTSYSQNGEDRIIVQELYSRGRNAPGRLLDIGAWDPEALSNSRALIQEYGWSAVLVEPSPGPMRRQVAEYGRYDRVTLIQAAFAGGPGSLVRMEISDDGLSSSDVDHVQRWYKVAKYLGRVWVPTVTVAQICEQFGGDFQFVSIDAEGLSVEILKAVLATELRPHVICFEHEDRHVEAAAAYQPLGYRQILLNAENSVIAL